MESTAENLDSITQERTKGDRGEVGIGTPGKNIKRFHRKIRSLKKGAALKTFSLKVWAREHAKISTDPQISRMHEQWMKNKRSR